MIQLTSVSLGADPEAFLMRDGVIVGSEKVIPPSLGIGDVVVRDGVQIELHPQARSYPSGVTGGIGQIFKQLQVLLDKTPEIQVCFKPVIEVSETELESLSDESRLLGCKPSQNIYGFRTPDVDGKIIRTRSAAGHVHLGLEGTSIYEPEAGIDFRTRLVPAFDIVLGNTCVMIDTDPSQRVRRKLYGRPGEYRLPQYGLEYRTLSNFWLRSPALAEFVMGMANTIVGIIHTTLKDSGENLEGELLAPVDWRRIVKAIYLNDAGVARENWKWVRAFLMTHAPESSPIHAGNMEKFDKFLSVVEKYGLGVFFPEDGETVMKGWTGTFRAGEWTRFIDSIQT